MSTEDSFSVAVPARSSEPIWSTDWPTESGWYWAWRPTAFGQAYREPVRLTVASESRRLAAILGAGMWEESAVREKWPQLRWGPRIEVPPGPDGTPGTRFANFRRDDAGCVVWLADDGEWQPRQSAARIFDSRNDAELHLGYGVFTVEIDDVDEFRAREAVR